LAAFTYKTNKEKNMANLMGPALIVVVFGLLTSCLFGALRLDQFRWFYRALRLALAAALVFVATCCLYVYPGATGLIAAILPGLGAIFYIWMALDPF
jgi:hypothetical protein